MIIQPFKLTDEQKKEIRNHVLWAAESFEQAWDHMFVIEKLTSRKLEDFPDLCQLANLVSEGPNDDVMQMIYAAIEKGGERYIHGDDDAEEDNEIAIPMRIAEIVLAVASGKFEVVTLGTVDLGNRPLMRVRIGDPCYEDGTWCLAERTDIKPGQWNALSLVVSLSNPLDVDRGRTAALIVLHDSIPASVWPLIGWSERNTFGVDSGMAGVEGTPRRGADRSWEPGVQGNAVFTTSGWGDGGYDYYVAYDDDENVVAIMLDYGI